MANLSTKVKKMNIFQKIRFNLVYRKVSKKGITYDNYAELPEYIRNNPQIISKINKIFNNDELKKIDTSIIIPRKQDDVDFLSTYQDEELYQFFKERLINISKENQFIYEHLILSGKFDLLALNHDKLNFAYGSTNNKEYVEGYFERELISKKEELIPYIINYSSDGNKFYNLLEEKPQYISKLDYEKQFGRLTEYIKRIDYVKNYEQNYEKRFELISKYKDLISHGSYEVKKGLIEKNINNFQYLDLETKKTIIKENPKLFTDIDTKSKFQLAQIDTRLYEYISPNEQREFIKYIDDGMNLFNKNIEYTGLFRALMRKNINNIGMFNFNQISPFAYDFLDDIKNLNDNTFIRNILECKLMNASGTIQQGGVSIHGVEIIDSSVGRKVYNDKQIKFMQALDIEQIKMLIKSDVNYVLAYLYTTENEGSDSQIENANKLFEECFGKDKFEEYKPLIQQIFAMNKEFKENIEQPVGMEKGWRMSTDELTKMDKVPLHEFKILFNSNIIEKCPVELIKKYIENKAKGQSSQEEFKEIIRITYGDKAKVILDSRNNLDVHAINSLEIFDDRILRYIWRCICT